MRSSSGSRSAARRRSASERWGDSAGPAVLRRLPRRPGVLAARRPIALSDRLRLATPNRVSAAAKYLGLTEAQLFKQLSSGKSLAQIATARGKSVSGLKAAMTAAIKARLGKALADKLITSAQEQKLLGRLSSVLDAQINRSGFGSALRPGVQAHFRRPPVPVVRPARRSPGAGPAGAEPTGPPDPPDPSDPPGRHRHPVPSSEDSAGAALSHGCVARPGSVAECCASPTSSYGLLIHF